MVEVGIQGSTRRVACSTLAGMAMGTTRDDGSQQSMWVATTDLPRNAGHPFYERLNRILCAAGFDAFVEGLCARFYTTMGRPSLAPGRYFRLLLLGYFEGLDSERAIAWRATDSLSLRAFLHLAPPAAPPDPFDDRRRHAPWPPGAGRVGCMGADQTVGRPVGRSRAGLGAVSARFAVHSLATALSGLPALNLNTEDFCHGLLGRPEWKKSR